MSQQGSALEKRRASKQSTNLEVRPFDLLEAV